ncbi:MAG: Ig-like domain-containing protein, partial [Thermoplasmata archaeon]
MKLVKGIAALFIVMLILGVVPLVSAERDSLKVIITAEDKIYRIDDTIHIEVRVYNKGELTDADEIEVTLDTRWQGTDIDVDMSWVSTGVYQGSYQILDDDHHAYFNAYAVNGSDGDGAELDIEVYHDRLELVLNFANQNHAYVWSGESVTATITSRYRGDLVDVDEFTYLRLVYPSDEVVDLNSTRVSGGTYKVTCVIPEVSDDGDYELEARATYAQAHADAQAIITVNLLSVWYKLESIAGNTATFTLGVADENGDAVANAAITITQPQQVTGTTGEDGTAIFSLTGVWDGIHVRGEVSANGKNQSFNGHIYTTDPEEAPNPAQHSFDVIFEGQEFIYKSGSSVKRSYKAYNSSIPMQNGEIFYYITLQGVDMDIDEGSLFPAEEDHIDGTALIIKTGTVTTDQLGGFSISFAAPSDQGYVHIYFESGIARNDYNYHRQSLPSFDNDDGLVYEWDYDSVFISKGDLWNAKSIAIESDPLVVGGKTKITIKTTGSLGDEDQLIAKWMPGIPTSGQYIDTLESEWISWVEGGNMIFLEKTDADNEFTGHTVIPDFMSKEGDYTIVAGYIDGDTGYPYVQNVALKEGESAGDQGLDFLILLLLLAAIAFVLIALAFGAFTSERGKRGGENPPSEGDASPPGDTSFLESSFPEHAKT